MKNFKELEDRMSPEAIERSNALAQSYQTDMLVKPRCADCRHWSELVKRKGVGSCMMCGYDGLLGASVLMAVSSKDADGVYLVTSADFGCVLFRGN